MGISKMRKAAKILDIIINVIQKVMIVLAVAAAVMEIIILFSSEEFFSNLTMTVDLGHMTLTLADADNAFAGIVRKYWLVAILAAIAALLLICYGIQIVRRILKPMRDGLPFASSVSGNIRKLGWLILIGGILDAMFQVGERILLTNTFDFYSLFNMETVSNCEINHNSDITFLVFSCVLFLLSYIFQYGEELQRESDETL